LFVPVGSDRYYMNEQTAQEFLAAQRRRALVVTGLLLVLFLFVLLVTKRW
jgi:hypothetical protein